MTSAPASRSLVPKIALLLGCGGVVVASPLVVKSVPASTILVLLALALGLLVGATMARGFAANALGVMASIAVALAAIETVCLTLTRHIEVFGNPDLIAQGPPLGWSLKSGRHPARKTVDGRVIYDVTYGVDPSGHRAVASAATGGGFVFLGDSFTFGEGLNDPDTWSQAFADRLERRIPVADLGVPAYSPAQVLRELQLGLYDEVLKPARAFVMLTAAWHADRVACKQDFVVGAPRFVTGAEGVRDAGFCQPLPHTAFERYAMATATYQVLIASRRLIVDGTDIARYIAVVGEAARVARQTYHVPLVVVYLRNAGYLHFTGYTDDDILKAMRADGVEVVDMTMPNEGRPEVVIAGDGHPNGAGNRIRAGMLLDYMKVAHPALLAP